MQLWQPILFSSGLLADIADKSITVATTGPGRLAGKLPADGNSKKSVRNVCNPSGDEATAVIKTSTQANLCHSEVVFQIPKIV